MRRRVAEDAVGEALQVVREGLAGGLSVRQGILRAGAAPESPLHDVARILAGGSGLDEALRDAARRASEPEVAAALTVLRVHLRAGGDPLPALAAARERLRRRSAAARERRALTTQARLSARGILLLAPGFLALLLLADPAGTWAVLSRPEVAALVGAGLGLQLLGGVWIGRIVRGPRSTGIGAWASGVPVVRAAAVLLGRRNEEAPLADEVVRAAGIMALLLDAGSSSVQALRLTAPVVPGPFGEALRRTARRLRAGGRVREALDALEAELPEPEVERFVRLLGADALGLPLASGLRRLAEELERDQRAAAAEHARAASVRVLVPLGLLVLPAFVLTCLVPLLLAGLEGIAL